VKPNIDAGGEIMRVLVIACVAWLTPTAAFAQGRPFDSAQGRPFDSAQGRRDATLLVTVLDETRAVLPGAAVTVTGIEAANTALEIPPGTATDRGQVTFANLTPGRYAIRAEFSGFQPRVAADVRIRSGENRQVLVLALDRLRASVTVERDRQQAAADRDVTFGTVLTREQIDALSDDPEELRRQLMEIAGPDATILVDSFEGRELPPKAQIKSIRVTRDQFAPEVHGAGHIRIEVLTQPGIGPIRGGARMGFYDSALDGRNPLVGQRGPAQSKMYGVSLSGTLINERSSFFLSVNGQESYSTPVQYAATPTGALTGNINLRNPFENMFVSGGMDYALTRDQVLRLGINRGNFSRRNMGIGAYDLIERAYSTEDESFGVYMQQAGPLGRRFVLNTRLSINGSDSVSESAVDAPTIVVNDAFTSGGAQRRGGTHSRNYWFNSDLDYVRGIHSMRTGIELQVNRYRSDSTTNYLGTYVFESLEAYEARRPRSYSRRIGDPNVKYSNVQGAFYVQDDIRPRKGLTLTGGVRYEAQAHVPDVLNFAPRFGFTWAPFKSGKTTLRGSWGIFYDWLPTGIYGQTLQVDGFRQREVNIINPTFPDPDAFGAAPPTNRYLLSDDRTMARSSRVSAGISHAVTPRLTVSSVYSLTSRDGLLVGRNLNAPVAGLRPDPSFANTVEAVSEGRGRAHSLSTTVNLNMGAAGGGPGGGMMVMMGGMPGGPGASGPRFSWRRGLVMFGSYSYGRQYDDTDGAFSIPASGNLAEEWGPAAFDRRHGFNVSLSSAALRNFNARVGVGGSSAGPLTIRTGTDDNADLVFNDRPAGIGRNSARTTAQWNSSANFGYSFALGKKQVSSGGGVQIMGSPGGGLTVNTMGAQTVPRYRLNLAVGIQNLLNKPVYTGYSGVMISPFFLKPTSASGVRRVTFNANVSF
jgi:hypothetical protein